MRKQCFSANVFYVVLKEVPHLQPCKAIMAYNRVEKRGHCHGHGHCLLPHKDISSCVKATTHLLIMEHVKVNGLAFFQAKLEELQAEKQGVVSQKEAADDGNRKLVSADCFVCLVGNTYSPRWR